MSSDPSRIIVGNTVYHRQLVGINPPVAGDPAFRFYYAMLPQSFSQHRMVGGLGSLGNNFASGYIARGRSLSPVSPVIIQESLGNEYFGTTLVTYASMFRAFSTQWVGAADSAYGGAASDCALLAAEVYQVKTSNPILQQEVTLSEYLNVRDIDTRPRILQRIAVDGQSYSGTGVGATFAFASYDDRPMPVLPAFTSSRPLSSRSTVIFPGWARSYVGVLSAVDATVNGADETPSENNAYNTLGEIASCYLARDYVSTPWDFDQILFSSITKDPRDKAEYLTVAFACPSLLPARIPSSWTLASRVYQTVPYGEADLSAARHGYLRLALVSAPLNGVSTTGFNAALSRCSQFARASRGSSTGGNSAMPIDYEEWDFAATCQREFLSQGVPYYPTSTGIELPAGHDSVTLSEYNRQHTPDNRGIGSATSMLPDRELIPNNSEKAYYHFMGENQPADLRVADFSLVMLKGFSLFASGIEASEAASLMPVLRQGDQSNFRFAGKNISSTTVRFEAESAFDGVSYGREQNLEALPAWEFPATDDRYKVGPFYQDFQPGNTDQIQSDSGDYLVLMSNYFSGDLVWNLFNPNLGFQTSLHGKYCLARATSAGLAGFASSSQSRIYNFYMWVFPQREGRYGVFSGMHNRRYNESQLFAANQAYSETGFLAGYIVDNLLRSRIGDYSLEPPLAPPASGFGRLTRIGDASLIASALPRNILEAATFNILPAVCGKDFVCVDAPIAGKPSAAGVFSYDGAGPSETVSVPYSGRGVQLQAFPTGSFEVTTQDPYVHYSATMSPADFSANIDVELNTEQVSVWVQWHSSLQGLGAYKANRIGQEGIDIDDQQGKVSPFHYVRTSRIGELSPVLVADLWMTATGRVNVSSQWTVPEGMPAVATSFNGERKFPEPQNFSDNPPAYDLSDFDVCATFINRNTVVGDTTSFYNTPLPTNVHSTQPPVIGEKVPFFVGTFVFNRDQTAALLRGEEVSPTRWAEFDEGDPRGNEPKYVEWHNTTFATIKPVFKLSFA